MKISTMLLCGIGLSLLSAGCKKSSPVIPRADLIQPNVTNTIDSANATHHKIETYLGYMVSTDYDNREISRKLIAFYITYLRSDLIIIRTNGYYRLDDISYGEGPDEKQINDTLQFAGPGTYYKSVAYNIADSLTVTWDYVRETASFSYYYQYRFKGGLIK